MTIQGTTELIAHIGFPTTTFTSPLIYNPYFEHAGIDAVVVPMACHYEHFPDVLAAVFMLANVRGALITMPHKVTAATMVDEASPAVRAAGSCNAVRRMKDGRLQGDLFDGEGFVRALRRNGCDPSGASALVVGAGGVGSAIGASLAEAGVRTLALFDAQRERARELANRLAALYPRLTLTWDSNSPAGHDIVVNATPMGTDEGDPLPVDVNRLNQGTWVGDVVLIPEMTPFLSGAQARGCRVQVGTDMLFEQIPAYLEFFGFPTTSPDQLRLIADSRRNSTSQGPPRS